MRLIISIVSIALLLITKNIIANNRYTKTLCKNPDYTCIKVKRGQSLANIVNDESGREIVKRINRINTEIYPGMTIAIPNKLSELDLLKVAPFPHQREPLGKTTIIVDLSDQAFGAYNAMGTLIHWGPISSGQGWCPDTEEDECHTPIGTYYIIHKGGANCVSSIYPIGEGGAPMPYCMFFHGGYALHGGVLPGYNASHGCIRLMREDAEWLNQEFIELGTKRTKVIVQE